MKKKLVLFFLLLLTLPLIGQEDPVCIDFGDSSPSWDVKPYSEVINQSPRLAFNGSRDIGAFVHYLIDEFEIESVVETGTYLGNTTAFFAQVSKDVHTVEVIEETYQSTKNKLKDFPNIAFHLGSSDAVLPKLLPKLASKRTLFYLDAHWYENWPLLKELEAIAQTHYDNCVVVIDDFKVPGRKDIPYDFYGKHECSLEYIFPKLTKVFSDFQIYLLIPKDKSNRAKFVAYPKSWTKSTHQ